MCVCVEEGWRGGGSGGGGGGGGKLCNLDDGAHYDLPRFANTTINPSTLSVNMYIIHQLLQTLLTSLILLTSQKEYSFFFYSPVCIIS